MHPTRNVLIKFTILMLFTGLLHLSCTHINEPIPPADRPYLLVLGTAQDGGFPQAGCTRNVAELHGKTRK